MTLFNPRATIEVVRFDEQRMCLVVDDALLEPERLLQYCAEHRDDFQAVDFSVYPGIYLAPPAAVASAVADFFLLQARRYFDARRCIDMTFRLSMVTLPAEQLTPLQSLCHIDNRNFGPVHSLQAAVLYLFRDEALGGTGFYVPARPPAELEPMLKAAETLPMSEFSRQYGISAGYMSASNPYYRRVGGISARWNRLIFYDGGELHSGDITAPERLSHDPLAGRLTLNGFFTSRRHLK